MFHFSYQWKLIDTMRELAKEKMMKNFILISDYPNCWSLLPTGGVPSPTV